MTSTLAEMWYVQGYQRGYEQGYIVGYQLGRLEALRELIHDQFIANSGLPPAQIVDQLQTWSRERLLQVGLALVQAKSLEELGFVE